MNSSLSRELSLLNLGEPTVVAKFVYGRFVADESVSEPTELDTTDPTRYVELLITTPKNVIRADEMPSALITETNFLSGDFSLITIDGSKTPDAFIAAVSSSLLLLSSDRIVGGQSKKEITKSLDNATPDHVTTLSLNSALSTLIPAAPVVDSQFNNASKAIARSRINSRIVHDITSKIATNITSPGAAAAAAAASMTKSAQNAAINAGWIQNQQSLEDGKFTPIKNGAKAIPTIVVRGFLIEKQEINVVAPNTTTKQIYVKASVLTKYVDPSVKYGSAYRYLVKTVADVSIPAITDTGVLGYVTVSCLSSGTIQDVFCEELVPPPSPADFTADIINKLLTLSWSMPVNRQRDIVKFQIYKRRSLQEPFLLLVEIDFSPIQVASVEKADKVIKAAEALTYYIDNDFVSGDIYAIASIDAHSMSSAYSAQLRCTFNGSLKLERVIPQGCPKAYPNLFYPADPFPDVVLESGKSKCSVIFSPEHISISTNRNKSERVVVLETEGSYTLQIISLDALYARNIKINIRDSRSN